MLYQRSRGHLSNEIGACRLTIADENLRPQKCSISYLARKQRMSTGRAQSASCSSERTPKTRALHKLAHPVSNGIHSRDRTIICKLLACVQTLLVAIADKRRCCFCRITQSRLQTLAQSISYTYTPLAHNVVFVKNSALKFATRFSHPTLLLKLLEFHSNLYIYI